MSSTNDAGDGPAEDARPLALVVEDNIIERTLLRAALERAGFSVIEAHDGEQALAIFEARAPDVVLLDIMMPGIDGFETCRRIRRLACGVCTPVIVTTSLEDEEAIGEAYAAGATDFISKPVNLSALMHRTRYVLRTHRVLANLDVLTGLPRRSVGVALACGSTPSPELIERAETAMDQAKHVGRDASCFYDPSTAARARRTFALERVLRRALETDCFRMHFQPKIDLATGRLRGMEALMRLDHPGFGPIAPDDFIPAAEQAGLIVALDRFALLASCREARRAAAAGLDGLTVAVKLSASMFQEHDLAQQVTEVLAETGLPARLLYSRALPMDEFIAWATDYAAKPALLPEHA